MADIINVHNVEKFIRDGSNLLSQVIANFFSADVELIFQPTNVFAQQYGIDISIAPLRNVYVHDLNTVFFLPRLYQNMPNDEDLISYLGIKIVKIGVGTYGRIFNVLCDAITRRLSDSYRLQFKLLRQYFDDSLITYTIANYFSKGKHNPTRVAHLINHFNSLRTTSFEGHFFSTGLILTKSKKAYQDPTL